MRIHTWVGSPVREVFHGMDRQLFEDLRPPGLPMTILRFDGSCLGDWIELEVGPSWCPHRWRSLITGYSVSDIESWFVDTGRTLPPPLKRWKHRHIVARARNGSQIIDDLTFSTGFFPLDLLIYPFIAFLLLNRKPVYRRRFGKSLSDS